MKYTIAGFYQPKLVELKLNSIDAEILRWFVDFIPKMSKIEIDGKTFHWVNYQTIIDDLPAIEINNRETIARRFDKLVAAGIMEKTVQRAGGVFIGFRLLPRYLELVEYSTQKSRQNDSKVETLSTQKSEQNNSSINDSSIKLINSEKDKSFSKKTSQFDEDTNQVFEHYQNLSGVNSSKDKSIANNLKKIFSEYTIADVKLVIDWILQEQWYIANGQTGLSVITRPTKFYEKLERAKLWDKFKATSVQSQKTQVRILADGDVQINAAGEWLSSPQISPEMAYQSFNVIMDARGGSHE